MLKALSDYRRLMRAGTALARHDVVLPGAYQSRLPLPARIAGSVLRLIGGGAKGRPTYKWFTGIIALIRKAIRQRSKVADSKVEQVWKAAR